MSRDRGDLTAKSQYSSPVHFGKRGRCLLSLVAVYRPARQIREEPGPGKNQTQGWINKFNWDLHRGPTSSPQKEMTTIPNHFSEKCAKQQGHKKRNEWIFVSWSGGEWERNKKTLGWGRMVHWGCKRANDLGNAEEKRITGRIEGM